MFRFKNLEVKEGVLHQSSSDYGKNQIQLSRNLAIKKNNSSKLTNKIEKDDTLLCLILMLCRN